MGGAIFTGFFTCLTALAESCLCTPTSLAQLANAKAQASEEICHHKASDSLAELLVRLETVLGRDVLLKLCKFRVNRGPLVSQNPNSDFVNNADGSLYSHQRLGQSSFYVLTQSETKQKVADIRNASRYLGLPNGAIEVDAVDKNALPDDFVV